MARKSTKDLQLVVVGLFLTVFSIVFALAAGPSMGRWVALGFALLFGACTIGCALPLLGLVPQREINPENWMDGPPRYRPSFELAGPVITSIKGLGDMRRYADPRFSDWLCSGPVRVELFEGKLLPFNIETEEVDLDSSREAIESAVANFLALNIDRREGIAELVYKNCEVYIEEFDPPPSEVKDPSDLWKYIYPQDVTVKQGEDKDFYIVVSSDCGWDPEHGLEMVFKHGDQIVSVGQAGEWY